LIVEKEVHSVGQSSLRRDRISGFSQHLEEIASADNENAVSNEMTEPSSLDSRQTG